MIQTEAPAGAWSPVAGAHCELKEVLAGYDTARKSNNKRRDFKQLRLKRPKFKALVLTVAPGAAVRRIGSTYECYIGGEHVQCRGMHTSPDKAWVCLARYLVTHDGEVQA